ncbi:hypothetical protein DPMN_162899 [Dreissena polymorpha]|uniref:Uncharacterized protein n=1 Tax=Dreissena polymorpha TaxID=45954 RepID=A0A9D4ESZ5_DREPO|nr:hypothetical protein DPMN_162899 [Dreissena polymorpha]
MCSYCAITMCSYCAITMCLYCAITMCLYCAITAPVVGPTNIHLSVHLVEFKIRSLGALPS